MTRGKTHPIYFAAAVAVLLFSLLGAVAPNATQPGAGAKSAAAAH
jgi:hypothetical protein